MNNIHIGDLIARRIQEIGMSKAEFGRRIQTSRQNVNTLLARESFDVKLLGRISRVLDRDFVAEFLSIQAKGATGHAGLDRYLVVLEVTAEEYKTLVTEGGKVKVAYHLPNGPGKMPQGCLGL